MVEFQSKVVTLLRKSLAPRGQFHETEVEIKIPPGVNFSELILKIPTCFCKGHEFCSTSDEFTLQLCLIKLILDHEMLPHIVILAFPHHRLVWTLDKGTQLHTTLH